MSLYIKGMPMPNEKDFPFELFFRCTNYTDMKLVIRKDGKEQVYDLVEVPESHGRLFDETEVKKCLDELQDDEEKWAAVALLEWAIEKRWCIEAEGE